MADTKCRCDALQSCDSKSVAASLFDEAQHKTKTILRILVNKQKRNEQSGG
jgi:hypothetical protein